MNKYIVKNLIFDLFDKSRIMFNDYYNGKEEYTTEDIERIKDLLEVIKIDVKQIKYEVESYVD